MKPRYALVPGPRWATWARRTSAILGMIMLASCTEACPRNYSKALSIKIKRPGCYGSCPVYDLTIDAGGGISYDGHHFTRHCGEATGYVNPAVFRDAVSRLKAVGFYSLPESYEGNMDGGALTVTLRFANGEKDVATDGRTPAGQELYDIADALVEKSGAAVWIEGCKKITNDCGCPDGSFAR